MIATTLEDGGKLDLAEKETITFKLRNTVVIPGGSDTPSTPAEPAAPELPFRGADAERKSTVRTNFCGERSFMKYDFKAVEAKWQKVWQDEHTFHAEIDHSKPKFYALVEFPYPSAAGLHVGHPRSYTALDIVARKKRQCGYNVLYPMGWDAFGLPTENYALTNHLYPAIGTAQPVARSQ